MATIIKLKSHLKRNKTQKNFFCSDNIESENDSATTIFTCTDSIKRNFTLKECRSNVSIESCDSTDSQLEIIKESKQEPQPQQISIESIAENFDIDNIEALVGKIVTDFNTANAINTKNKNAILSSFPQNIVVIGDNDNVNNEKKANELEQNLIHNNTRKPENNDNIEDVIRKLGEEVDIIPRKSSKQENVKTISETDLTASNLSLAFDQMDDVNWDQFNDDSDSEIENKKIVEKEKQVTATEKENEKGELEKVTEENEKINTLVLVSQNGVLKNAIVSLSNTELNNIIVQSTISSSSLSSKSNISIVSIDKKGVITNLKASVLSFSDMSDEELPVDSFNSNSLLTFEDLLHCSGGLPENLFDTRPKKSEKARSNHKNSDSPAMNPVPPITSSIANNHNNPSSQKYSLSTSEVGKQKQRRKSSKTSKLYKVNTTDPQTNSNRNSMQGFGSVNSKSSFNQSCTRNCSTSNNSTSSLRKSSGSVTSRFPRKRFSIKFPTGKSRVKSEPIDSKLFASVEEHIKEESKEWDNGYPSDRERRSKSNPEKSSKKWKSTLKIKQKTGTRKSWSAPSN
eukprot:Pgem_evm1s62